MNESLTVIRHVYARRQYQIVVVVTLLVTIMSSLGVWQILKNHKGDLVKEVHSKSRFILTSIERRAYVDILIGDVFALKEIESELINKDPTIESVSFYTKGGKLVYGKKGGVQFNGSAWEFSHSEGEIRTVYSYSAPQFEADTVHLVLVVSDSNIELEVRKLRNHSIVFIVVLVFLLNTALFRVFYDLEISIQKEAALKAEAEVSKKKERVQRKFLANMSHELRTPLNAIVGFTKLLSETNDEEKKREYSELLNKSAEHMKNLISDVLDLTKIQEDKLVLDAYDFDLWEMYNNVVQTLEHRVSDRVYLINQSSKGESLVVYGDGLRLKQVMINLLNNAIKYTEVGYVKPQLECREEGEGFFIRFQVVDSGIGVPEDLREVLFQDFVQTHSPDLKIEGTGLGLSISKKIIELFGGVVGFEPNPEGGSIFYFELFLAKGKIAVNRPTVREVACFSDVSILIAEDNEFNKILIENMLERYQFKKLNIVSNGKEAVDAVKAFRYDIVLMDIQMPVMGGVEALEVIRVENEDLPVLALTANAVKGDADFFISKGFNAYISKPIDEDTLISAIEQLLSLSNESELSRGEAADASGD